MQAYTSPPTDKTCPFHNKYMSRVCGNCPMWINIRGINPNTGNETDGYNCAIAWQPLLLIENSGLQRQTGAAVESLRNEVAKDNASISRAMPMIMKAMGQQRSNGNVISLGHVNGGDDDAA